MTPEYPSPESHSKSTRLPAPESGATRVRVKVCGLTRVEDALACAAAGVDWIGLNFHPGSLRKIEPAQAASIVAALPDATEAVGLFVDRPPSEVAAICGQVGLRIVQLHGAEPPEHLAALEHLTIIRAFRLGDAAMVGAMISYLDRCRELGRLPDAVLVDAYVPGHAGGTGREVLPEVLDLLPSLRPNLPPLILAGGLTPENVASPPRELVPGWSTLPAEWNRRPVAKIRIVLQRLSRLWSAHDESQVKYLDLENYRKSSN